MNTNSIEYKSENIYHSKTKEYFEEVLSSYHNGNYRSAIVMLYSVVVCDVIYKLEELSDKYSDEKAKDILDKIKKEQKDSPRNPKWEQTLIEEVKDRTSLLENQDKDNLDYLRNQRHLSAHPILDQLDILISPNKETVRANIVNMLDGVLCKPPLLSRDLTATFIEDLSTIKDQLFEDDLERYLYKKYFNNINRPTEERLFRDLWKFVFRLENEKATDNRKVNYSALVYLYRKEPTIFKQLIESDNAYYSHVNLSDNNILKYLMLFFSTNPNTYQYISEDTKLLIEAKVKTEEEELLPLAVFLSDTFEDHINKLKNKISSPIYTAIERELLFRLSERYNAKETYLNYVIDVFADSRSYNTADRNFRDHISAYFDHFTKDQYIRILESINENSQLYRRGWATKDNTLLKNSVEEKFENQIDFEKYPNFEYDDFQEI